MKVHENVIRAAMDRAWRRAGFRTMRWPDGSTGVIDANSRHCKIAEYMADEILSALGVEFENEPAPAKKDGE